MSDTSNPATSQGSDALPSQPERSLLSRFKTSQGSGTASKAVSDIDLRDVQDAKVLNSAMSAIGPNSNATASPCTNDSAVNTLDGEKDRRKNTAATSEDRAAGYADCHPDQPVPSVETDEGGGEDS